MEHAAPAWALWLEHSELGDLLRTSPWLYPAANVTHVVMMGLLVGAIVALDLRLLGLAQRIDAAAMNRYLTRFVYLALPFMVLTGISVFAAAISRHIEEKASGPRKKACTRLPARTGP